MLSTYEPEVIAGNIWEGVGKFGAIVICHCDLMVAACVRRYTRGGEVKSIEVEVRLPARCNSERQFNNSAIVHVNTYRDLIPFLEHAIDKVREEKQRRMLDAIAGNN